jgi:hypothetical protein
MSSDRRARDHGLLTLTGLFSVALAASVGVAVLAQQPAATPQTFHTTARFSVDSDVLRLQTAVAIAESHASFRDVSWLHLYFYAFPLTPDDVAGLSAGSIDGLERKRTRAVGGPDRNHSRAVLHLLLDRDSRLSNASLEVPGLTCTIVVESATAKNAVQDYQFDGKRLQVKARGASTCDLTSVGGGKRGMSWDVDVNIPVFVRR